MPASWKRRGGFCQLVRAISRNGFKLRICGSGAGLPSGRRPPKLEGMVAAVGLTYLPR